MLLFPISALSLPAGYCFAMFGTFRAIGMPWLSPRSAFLDTRTCHFVSGSFYVPGPFSDTQDPPFFSIPTVFPLVLRIEFCVTVNGYVTTPYENRKFIFPLIPVSTVTYITIVAYRLFSDLLGLFDVPAKSLHLLTFLIFGCVSVYSGRLDILVPHLLSDVKKVFFIFV